MSTPSQSQQGTRQPERTNPVGQRGPASGARSRKGNGPRIAAIVISIVAVIAGGYHLVFTGWSIATFGQSFTIESLASTAEYVLGGLLLLTAGLALIQQHRFTHYLMLAASALHIVNFAHDVIYWSASSGIPLTTLVPEAGRANPSWLGLIVLPLILTGLVLLPFIRNTYRPHQEQPAQG